MIRNKNDEIVWLSLPFLAGMLATTFALHWLGGAGGRVLAGAAETVGAGGGAGALAGVALAAALACLALAGARQGRTAIQLGALFFCLGIFCRAASELFPGALPAPLRIGPPTPGTEPAGSALSIPSNTSPPTLSNIPQRALQRLCALIEAVPFNNPNTGALLRALFTGQKDLLPKATINSFRAAGASHILALSGLHLGIIYLVLDKLLSIFGNSPTAYKIRSLCILLFSGFYVLTTGASPSIVRAFIFILIREIARHFKGRRASPLTIWCTALIVQLSANPSTIESPGFQLSYLAMLGITVLFPLVNGLYPVPPPKGKKDLSPSRLIWNSMSLSISCQAFTAPVAWLHFESFPKFFLLTNLLALPLTEILMIMGLSCVALSSIKICPQFLIMGADYVSETLVRVLSIIAVM